MAAPASVGLSRKRLEQIDVVVEESIAKHDLPGAVVLVGRHGRVAYRRAYGQRSLQPQVATMGVDTVFDLASLTKVVATATSVMILVERGRMRLEDRVSTYIPEFGQNGKQNVTVEQLLTHQAGFVPDNELEDYQNGPELAVQRICALRPMVEPGTRMIYSDVGYIVLGEIIGKVTGKRLDTFARENIFVPLGMKDTQFMPDSSLRNRIAPTEQRESRWMVGEVHDPRAYLLGGVAGHAGLFGTADDLSRYCQMILNRGVLGSVRILSGYGVDRMTRPVLIPDGNLRAIGWDIDSRRGDTHFSANRGDLFPIGSFGHSGFTGTSIWIDPRSDTFVIFLSNRVHPDGKGDVTALRGKVATIAAGAIDARKNSGVQTAYSVESGARSIRDRAGAGPARPKDLDESPAGPMVDLKPGPVQVGIDVQEEEGFARLRGSRIGLVTNHTGRDRRGQSTIDLLHAADGVKLVALFSPEHGIRGTIDANVPDSKDEKTGVPIFSLYGERRRPAPEQLKDLDALVYDIQDIGTRFYTYISTLGYVMEEAAKLNLKVFILDRPNPINGVDVSGPLADADQLSFTAYHQIPVRHGMTVGELALLFNRERMIGAKLEVIQMKGWSRSMWFDGTGLTWANPSPNMRSLTAATLYPGIGLLETTNLSVGRGTDTPFEVVGAPWIKEQELAKELNGYGLQGIRFVPVRFTPRASVYAGVECGGINLIVTDRVTFEPVRCGLTIAQALLRLYPESWEARKFSKLLANKSVFEAILRGATESELHHLLRMERDRFLIRRAPFLLY